MPNYKCKFQNEWLNEYKWLQKVVGDDSKAKCKMCQSIFSIASHGHGALLQHKKSGKHNEAENAAAKSTSVDQMFKRSPESDKLAAMEATYVYHIIKEGQSFASTKCTANLFRTVFEVNENFTCGPTKAEAIATGKLILYFVFEQSKF